MVARQRAEADGPGAVELVNARANLALVTDDPVERDAILAVDTDEQPPAVRRHGQSVGHLADLDGSGDAIRRGAAAAVSRSSGALLGARLRAFRASRDGAISSQALVRLTKDAAEDRNLMPALVAAVSARATLGEIVKSLKEVYGEHVPR